MSKHYCLIPFDWELSDLANSNCRGPAHRHIGRSKAEQEIALNLVEVLRPPVFKHGKLQEQGVLRERRTVVPSRGLSCFVGAPLAVAVVDSTQRDWATTMVDSIFRR